MTDVDEPVSRLVDVIETPLELTEFAQRCYQMAAKHGPDTRLVAGHGRYLVYTAGRGCGCGTCTYADAESFRILTGDLWPGFMILCPLCGNKRCPRAAHHDHECHGSNEPGQAGSNYY